jgi:hypothetical protein
MAALTKQEILAQLEKLGINSTPDINTYFQEYEEYSILQATHHHSAQVHYEGTGNN